MKFRPLGGAKYRRKYNFSNSQKIFQGGIGGLYERIRQIPVHFTICAKLNFLGHQVAYLSPSENFCSKLGNSLGALIWNFWRAVSCSLEGHVCTLHNAVNQFSRKCTVNVLQEAEYEQKSMFSQPAKFGHLSRGPVPPYCPHISFG